MRMGHLAVIGAHRVNGVYGVTFDATDTATVGEMEVSVVVAGPGVRRLAYHEDLADPWARPPSAYAEMFDVIERSISPLIEHLEWLVSESG